MNVLSWIWDKENDMIQEPFNYIEDQHESNWSDPLERSSKLYLLCVGYAAWQKLRFRNHVFEAPCFTWVIRSLLEGEWQPDSTMAPSCPPLGIHNFVWSLHPHHSEVGHLSEGDGVSLLRSDYKRQWLLSLLGHVFLFDPSTWGMQAITRLWTEDCQPSEWPQARWWAWR